MFDRFNVRILTSVFAAFLLTACTFDQGIALSPSEPDTDKDGLPQVTQATFAQFQDIPIPGNAKMNMDRTLILGEKEAWIGRLVIDSRTPQVKLFDFFKHRMSQFGWQEITSVRSATSVLSYSKDNRIMTIQIQSHRFVGTQVDITMSPKGASTPPPVTNASFPHDTLTKSDKTVINPASLRPVEVR